MKAIIGATLLVVLVDAGRPKLPPGKPDFCPDDPRYKAPWFSLNTMCFKRSERVVKTGITPDQRKLILARHNKERRDEVEEHSASNVMEMQWDRYLERNAEQWAAMCTWGHDKDRRSVEHGLMYTGQNVASATGFISWDKIVLSWHKEIRDFVYGHISLKVTGHYTQAVMSKCNFVGCGYAKCKQKKGDGFKHHYVCNYAYGQSKDDLKHPFKIGPKCSGCKDTTAKHCHNGLCSCGKLFCANQGKLNPKTCKCKCTGPFKGRDCRKSKCDGYKDYRACGRKWFKDKCSKTTFAPLWCPNMCGTCPGFF